MSPLDHFTMLTSLRNCDKLCTAVATAFYELFDARYVSIHRPMGESGKQRWVTWLHAEPHFTDVIAMPSSSEFHLMPPLNQFPERCEAQTTALFLLRDGVHVSFFPLVNGLDPVDVLEMSTLQPLDAEARRVANAMLRVYANMRQLLDYGQRDSLTGLLNRKTFDEAFFDARCTATQASATHERRVSGEDSRHWVGMIDIDFFKRVNDSFGHLIGDEVLLLVAQLLRANCRPHDLIYRFGGEEFVVLLRCPREADAGTVFERLRQRIEQHRFPQVGEVTVSIGFAEMLAGDSPAAALGRADRAVYFAKEHGRNQVQSHAGLIRHGDLAMSETAGEVELF